VKAKIKSNIRTFVAFPSYSQHRDERANASEVPLIERISCRNENPTGQERNLVASSRNTKPSSELFYSSDRCFAFD